MSLFPAVTAVFLETIIARLTPWFLHAACGSLQAAREAALSMLASYDVRTEEEIRLAAEIASFGFDALDALGRSMDPDLPLNAVLRLRGSASSLHRSAHQCQRALDRLREQRGTTEAMPAQPVATAEPAANAEPAPRQAVDASEPSPSAAPSRPEVALSRQQRRAMQRAAEKARRQQAEQARRTLRASRTAAARDAGVGPSVPPATGQTLAA